MSKRLSILEVVFSEAWGGLEMLVGCYASYFQERGHKVLVISPPNDSLKNYLGENNVRWRQVSPVVRYIDVITAVKVARIIKKERIDIIHSHISRDLSTLRLAKNIACRGALVFTQHMDSRFPKRDIFHRWVYKGIDRIITITDSMRDHQLDFTPARPEQVLRIYNGIDITRFQPSTAAPVELKTRNNIPPERRVVSVIARLDRLKNQKLLVEAAPEIVVRHPDVLFLLAGDETPSKDGRGYRKELETAVRHLHLEKYFQFTGFCKNIEEVIALSELVVLTTPKESFGLVLIESMSMEKPVVGASAGGVLEIITDLETGRLFEPRQAHSLARAINAVLDDPEAARMMGKRGRKDVLKRFSMQKNFKLYEKEFYTLAG